MFISHFLQTASEYIKTFGLIQFCGLAVGPLTGAIFILTNSRSTGDEDQQFLVKIKSLSITSFILFLMSTCFIVVLLLQRLNYSVSALKIFFFTFFFELNFFVGHHFLNLCPKKTHILVLNLLTWIL